MKSLAHPLITLLPLVSFNTMLRLRSRSFGAG